MTTQELEALNDEELMRRLDKADDVNRLMEHEGWKPFEEAIRRIAVNAEDRLRKISPSEFQSLEAYSVKVVELQILVKLYRDILPSIKQRFEQDRQVAFDLANERGVIAKTMTWFANRSK